jgi:tRNA-dihydrouridine synthase B
MIKLKSFTLRSGIIQSPMAGCTDLAFRLIARERGMEFAFLEMVSADALVRKNLKTMDLMKSVEKDRPLGAQLVGCNPDTMGEAAAMIEAMGFDLLDINCGCPVPKVTSPGGGSALLIEPDKTRAIFRSVVKNVKKIPVTVKMRKGYEDPSGEEAVRLSKIAEDEGLDAVTVHGRTRAQGYSGAADWEAIAKVKKALKIPVIGNGDVVNASTAKRLMETSGCDGVMIGRGGLGNPWIYKSIEAEMNGELPPSPPTVAERQQAALQHLELELQTEAERPAILKFRRIGCWYFQGLPGSADLRARLNILQTADEMRDAIRSFGTLR